MSYAPIVNDDKIENIGNVNVSSSISNGQVLKYRDGIWENKDDNNSGTGATNLSELGDVNLTTGLANGKVLKYNGSKWTPQDDDNSGTGATNLSDLGDVDTTSANHVPTDGDVLYWNGSAGHRHWMPLSSIPQSKITNLSNDLGDKAPKPGSDGLNKWSGSSWAAATGSDMPNSIPQDRITNLSGDLGGKAPKPNTAGLNKWNNNGNGSWAAATVSDIIGTTTDLTLQNLTAKKVETTTSFLNNTVENKLIVKNDTQNLLEIGAYGSQHSTNQNKVAITNPNGEMDIGFSTGNLNLIGSKVSMNGTLDIQNGLKWFNSSQTTDPIYDNASSTLTITMNESYIAKVITAINTVSNSTLNNINLSGSPYFITGASFMIQITPSNNDLVINNTLSIGANSTNITAIKTNLSNTLTITINETCLMSGFVMGTTLFLNIVKY